VEVEATFPRAPIMHDLAFGLLPTRGTCLHCGLASCDCTAVAFQRRTLA
jgi:hypothetical protein